MPKKIKIECTEVGRTITQESDDGMTLNTILIPHAYTRHVADVVNDFHKVGFQKMIGGSEMPDWEN